MPTRKPFTDVTMELYVELRKSFGEHGKNWRAVSAACKCDPRTAKRAWEMGWPDKEMPPLRLDPPRPGSPEALMSEAERERTRLQMIAAAASAEASVRTTAVAIHQASRAVEESLERMQKHEESTRQNAEAAEREEAKLVQATRTLAIVHLAQVQKITHSLPALADKLKLEIDKAIATPGTSMDLLFKTVNRLMALTENASELGNLAMRMQRVALGQPTEILKVQNQELAPISDDEAIAELEAANRALVRVRSKTLVSIPGGQANAPPKVG